MVEIVRLHLDNAQMDSGLSDRARKLIEENAGAVALSHSVEAEDLDDNPLLVTLLVDNSESMEQKKDSRGVMVRASVYDPRSNAATVIRCQNATIDGLLRSQRPEGIYLSTQTLNSIDVRNPEHVVVDPYRPLASAIRLNLESIRFGGATPLYRRAVQVLAGVLYETQLAIDGWKFPRTSTLIISDGMDYPPGRGRYTAEDCAQLVSSMLGSPMRRHIVAAIGIENTLVDFRNAFSQMGIPDQWILTADATPQDITRAINRFTQAASKASNATEKEFLMLTDSGFRAITPSK